MMPSTALRTAASVVSCVTRITVFCASAVRAGGMLDDRFQRNLVVGHALGDRGEDADAVVHGQADEIAAGMARICAFL